MSTTAMRRHTSRARTLRRQVGHRLRGSVARSLNAASAGPLPPPLRRVLSSAAWRPGLVHVDVSALLLGGQNGLPAGAVAAALDDLLWGSRRVVEGPHAQLLQAHDEQPLSDAEILASPYAALARACIATSGEYFSARDDAGIVEVARDFLDRSAAKSAGGAARHPRGVRRPRQSAPGSPVLVAPVRDSDCYQVVDGHHRVAAAHHRGETTIPVRVRRVPVTTPLMDLLDSMSWIAGARELYQPVDAPELRSTWRVVRRCDDRLALMAPLLREVAASSPAPRYLDVASCYGWFVDRVGRMGFDAHGIEADPAAPRLGAAVYGLDPHRIEVGDAVDLLGGADRTWDVVSCFSLLHHFALGRARTGPEELLRLLDRATGRVLFLDTGQSHEEWFADSLPEWDTDHVRAFLERHGTFDRVIDLGPDSDAVAPYERNYGRHLFACVRDR